MGNESMGNDNQINELVKIKERKGEEDLLVVDSMELFEDNMDSLPNEVSDVLTNFEDRIDSVADTSVTLFGDGGEYSTTEKKVDEFVSILKKGINQSLHNYKNDLEGSREQLAVNINLLKNKSALTEELEKYVTTGRTSCFSVGAAKANFSSINKRNKEVSDELFGN